MDRRGRWRLAGMMGLIYAIQGAWWPLLAVHLKDLGIDGRGRGWIFATLALAAMATPLGAGQIADRLMPTQKLLALIYALGTGLLLLLAGGPTTDPGRLFGLFLAYWLLTAPSYGLANSLAMRNLPRPGDQFGGVRLWGTIGWMTVGWAVFFVMKLRGAGSGGMGAYPAFWVAAVLSAGFAAYCVTLPDTPPLGGPSCRKFDLRESLELIRRPAVAVFLATAFLVSLTTPFVYQTVPPYLEALGLPREWTAPAMTLGQYLEIGALAALPWSFRRFGSRGTLAVGVMAWALYYGVLSASPPLGVVLAILPLNGVAIACFIIAGQMFLDGEAPPHCRASAQGLHVMVTSGVGSLLGNLLAGETLERAGVGASVFLAPCALNLLALASLLALFRPQPGSVALPSPRPRAVRAKAVNLAAGHGDG